MAHSGPHSLNVRLHGLLVEFNNLSKIHLRDHRYISAVKDGGILQRLIFAFGNGKQNEAKIFSQVIRGRTNQVAHILNEKKIECANVPTGERVVDHGGFKMAERSGRNLLHRSLATRQPNRVVLGSEVTNQGRDTIVRVQEREGPFEKSCFAGTWAGDKAYDERSLPAETLAEHAGDDIVLFEDVFTHFQEARFGTHLVPPEQ